MEISNDAPLPTAGHIPKSGANNGRNEVTDLALNRDVSRNLEKCE